MDGGNRGGLCSKAARERTAALDCCCGADRGKGLTRWSGRFYYRSWESRQAEYKAMTTIGRCENSDVNLGYAI